MHQNFVCILLALLCLPCIANHCHAKDLETESWLAENAESVLQRRDFRATNGMDMPYRLFLPEGYESGQSYPLFIYLHGRGERGSENGPELYNGSPLFMGEHSIISPKAQKKFPCIILVPQCSEKTINEEWAKWVGNTPETPWEGLDQESGNYTQSPQPSDTGVAFFELVAHTVNSQKVDSRRIYLGGISMGGFGTWEYAMRRPNLFAAIVPMAGYSDQAKADSIAHIPCWIFHGGADKGNPTQGSRNMYRLLSKAGAEVRYTEYPNTKHSPTFQKAWKESELLPWIFAQKKTP